MSGPVTLINAFNVPQAESERFLLRWTENAQLMAGQPGFVRARLHRSLGADDALRFVNVAEWDSERELADAQADPDWRASVQRMFQDPGLHVTAHPAVYQVALQLNPGDTG
ncbi:antibiotic biosynthesis monooxygenase family protein [Streptacidiphilus sp. PAMC 29251]